MMRNDIRVTVLVGIAHALSHFLQLIITPVIPLIKSEFDLSFAAIGALMTVTYAVSGLMQFPAGMAVDRLGGRAVLVFGLTAMGLGTLLIGLAPSYAWLVVASAVIGIGNSTFHPADMALLNAKVTPSRLGYAFSMHSIAGSTGWILAPMFAASIAELFGWRIAMAAGALVVLVFVMYLATQQSLAHEDSPAPVSGGARPASQPLAEILLAPAVLICFVFFFFTSIAYSSFTSFGPAAFIALYEMPLVAASGILTTFFVGVTMGTLAGGAMAARTKAHGLVTAGGCGVAAFFALIIALGVLPAALVALCAALVGVGLGSTAPSRDILVREAAPANARGKVYGFVYSGLDVGAALAPVILGWFLDHQRPSWVFLSAAVLMVACIPCAYQLKRRVRRD
ncbi:MAG: MFS transporter [Betaproteobacteria bacterium]|nr:MFS transporter [Betaproteobacteria bacterium]